MIRQATKNDLPQIANVHTACFSRSFSTQLGKDLLCKMYSEYIEKTPELFLVAVEDDQIVGFANGYYYTYTDYMGEFQRKNRKAFMGKVLSLLITFNPAAWKKLYSTVFNRTKFVTTDEFVDAYDSKDMGDLLSICVLSQYRGKGIAVNLISEYESVLKKQGKSLITLSVDPSNDRGVAFYKKMGYRPYKQAKNSVSYAKVLNRC